MSKCSANSFKVAVQRLARLRAEIQSHLDSTNESARSLSKRAKLHPNFVTAFLSRPSWQVSKHGAALICAIDNYEGAEVAKTVIPVDDHMPTRTNEQAVRRESS